MFPLNLVQGLVDHVADVRNNPFVAPTEILRNAKPGDLIEFDRGLYRHWAMYLGDGYIINIPAESKEDKEVKITKQSLRHVAGESKVRVNNQERRAARLGYQKRTPANAVAAAMADEGKTYRHWAMYLGRNGNDGDIMNIPTESKEDKEVTIRKQSLRQIAGHCIVRVNNQESKAARLGYQTRTPSDAVAAAMADEGRTLPYNFTGTNCEYYSTMWLYGRGFSSQVDVARERAGAVATEYAVRSVGPAIFSAFLR